MLKSHLDNQFKYQNVSFTKPYQMGLSNFKFWWSSYDGWALIGAWVAIRMNTIIVLVVVFTVRSVGIISNDITF